MKFTSQKSDLLRAVRTAARVLMPGSTDRSLLNVLISAEATTVRAHGFGAQEQCLGIATAEVLEPGRVVLGGAFILELLTAAETSNSPTVTVSLDGSRAAVQSGDLRYRLPIADSFALPAWTSVEGSTMQIPAGTLQRLARRVVVAENAKGFDQVLFEVREGRLSMVATDGIRLALASAALPGVRDVNCRLPGGSVDTLVKSLEGTPDDEPVSVTIGMAAVGFKSSMAEYITRQGGGTFPNYRAILPKSSTLHMIANSVALGNAIKGVSPVTRNTHDRLKLEIGREKVTVLAASDESHARREVDVETQGEPFTVSFGGRYLRDFLSVVGSERVRLSLNGTAMPALLTPEGADDFTYLLMPVNL